MSAIFQECATSEWLSIPPQKGEIEAIQAFLEEQGTFQFPTVQSGLFSAAAGEDPQFRLTGYQNVWTRDNCHIAHALWKVGHTEQKQKAIQAVRALVQFYLKSEDRFEKVIAGEADPQEVRNRPHIRFDGDTLEEIDVRWAHAQNDALGYTVWLICQLLLQGDLQATPEMVSLLNRYVRYFDAIQYWQDDDSGHWEEARKIEASSIGAVVAGLKALQQWSHEHDVSGIDRSLLTSTIAQGEQALKQILPAECIQQNPLQRREYDAALLFLIEPLNVVADETAQQIVENVVTHLAGPIGVRRYLGDSYWCANYRDLLAPEVRTADFSDDQASRDQLLKPGEEAQWCLFDSILSVIFGKRFLQSGNPSDLDQQIHHFQRSLNQLTTAQSRFPAYRCPESYFLEKGEWIPNDITPLLWTQANLLLAFDAMKESAVARQSSI